MDYESKVLKNVEKKLTIKEFDKSQRPRERLLKEGVEFLSDRELLAILIDTGIKNRTAIDIAADLINYAGNLENLAKFDVKMLQKIKGIGLSKACKIIASLEFANRVSKSKSERKNPVRDAGDLIELFAYEFDKLSVEIFKVICLNRQNHIIFEKNLTSGTKDQTVLSVSSIFKEAILRDASSIIVMHNHPSGVPNPSSADLKTTKSIADAGKQIGIHLMDHIIYGSRDKYFSFMENGYID